MIVNKNDGQRRGSSTGFAIIALLLLAFVVVGLLAVTFWLLPGVVDSRVTAQLTAMPAKAQAVQQVVVTATPSPTSVPTLTLVPTTTEKVVAAAPTPVQVPTAVAPVSKCDGPDMKLDFALDPRSNPKIQLLRFSDPNQKNLYETSQLRVSDTLGCGGKVAVLFQDWEPVGGGKYQVGPNYNLTLSVGSDTNLQHVYFPNTATELSDHGQVAILGFGTCLELWQNDTDAVGGRDSGWYAMVCNTGQAKAATLGSQPCSGQTLVVDFSVNPRGKANKIDRMNSDTHNIYNASRIRLFPNPNPGGCGQAAKVLFQKWCDDNGSCVGNGGKPWLETAVEIKVNVDNNLQKIFFPGTQTDVNDKAQKMWLNPGQCVIFDENDTDNNGWEVVFCS